VRYVLGTNVVIAALKHHAGVLSNLADVEAADVGIPLLVGEVRAIEVRDIDLKQDLIRVRRAFSDDEVLTPKSGNERMVAHRRRPSTASHRGGSREATGG
jgi:hypothetical protein